MFLKVDFTKAYDSVDWSFLDAMLSNFNFNKKWRAWIKECVSSVYTSVLVNGSSYGEFKLERGLRQGDPLSPFFALNYRGRADFVNINGVQAGMSQTGFSGNG